MKSVSLLLAVLLALAVYPANALEVSYGYDPETVRQHYAAHPEYDPSTPEFAAREASLAAEKADEAVDFGADSEDRPMPCGKLESSEQCRKEIFSFVDNFEDMSDALRETMVEGAEALRCMFQTFGFKADIVKKTLGNIRRAVPELSQYKSIPDPLFVQIPEVKPRLIENLVPGNCMKPATPLVCAYIALLIVGNPAPKKDWDTLMKSNEAVDFMIRSGLLEGYMVSKSGVLGKEGEQIEAETEDMKMELQIMAQLWPIDRDLVIASDFTWPQKETSTANRGLYELVGYASPSSEGLVTNAPISPAETVLDVGTGSGIQAIAALRYYAERAVMVDINPRAVRFAKFNLLLNGMEDRAVVREGNLYDALTEEEVEEGFDVVLANPPSVAAPILTHSGKGAFSFVRNVNDGIVGRRPTPLWEDGGSSGEVVLSRIISGAGDVLKNGGRLVVAADLWDAFAYDQKLAAWLEPWESATMRDENGDFIHTRPSDASVEVDASGDVKVSGGLGVEGENEYSDAARRSLQSNTRPSVAYTYFGKPVGAKTFSQTMGGAEGMYPGTIQETTRVELDGTVEAWFENIEANGMSFVAPGFVYIFKGDASGNGGAVDIKAPTRVATANVGGPKGRGARYPHAIGHEEDWSASLPEKVLVTPREMRRSPSLGDDRCAKKTPETYEMHISRGNETQDELLDAFSSIPRLDYVTKVRGSKTGILIAVEHWWTKRAWKEGAKKDKKWRKKKKNLIENYVYAPLPLPEDLPEEPEEPEVPDPAEPDVPDFDYLIEEEMEDEDYITLEDGETILLSDVTDEGDEMENKEEDEDDVEAEARAQAERNSAELEEAEAAEAAERNSDL